MNPFEGISAQDIYAAVSELNQKLTPLVTEIKNEALPPDLGKPKLTRVPNREMRRHPRG